jgi:glycosyltransferase involved in cell wall biosynthesis
MRVGIEAQRLYRKKKHGMDIVALELIKNLHAFNSEFEFVVFVKKGEDAACLNDVKGIELVELPNAPYPIWEQFILPWAVKKYKVQLLHCTSNTAPLFLSVPLVVTLHDIIYLDKSSKSSSSFYQKFGNYYRAWVVPKIVKNAAKLITVSEFEKKNIQSFFNLEEGFVQTIYNGVGSHFKQHLDPKHLQDLKLKYQLPEEYIFFIGNTDPKKNVEGVLHALHLLKSKGKLSLKLVMPDMNREYIQSILVKLNAENLIQDLHILPYVPNSELPYILNLAKVFLYPSIRESFGIPILEAMKCGVPVIASNTSSMPEVAGDAAIFVNPFDVESIATAILSSLENETARLAYIQKGLKRAEQFTWNNNANETIQLYKFVLSNPKKLLMN